jgi:hypothetical protein
MNHGCVLCSYFVAVQDNEAALNLVAMVLQGAEELAEHVLLPLSDSAVAASYNHENRAVHSTVVSVMDIGKRGLRPVTVGTCETFLRMTFNTDVGRPPPDVVLVSFYFKYCSLYSSFFLFS